MDDLNHGPTIEKRIMPLLDIALSLVGVLILSVAMNNEPAESGISGNVATIKATENGDFLFGDEVLANNTGGINHAKMEFFFGKLAELDNPLVLIVYKIPSDG